MAILRWERTVIEQYWPGEDLPRKIEGAWEPVFDTDSVVSVEQETTAIWWNANGHWVHRCRGASTSYATTESKFCSTCGVAQPEHELGVCMCSFEWSHSGGPSDAHMHSCGRAGSEHTQHFCKICSLEYIEMLTHSETEICDYEWVRDTDHVKTHDHMCGRAGPYNSHVQHICSVCGDHTTSYAEGMR